MGTIPVRAPHTGVIALRFSVLRRVSKYGTRGPHDDRHSVVPVVLAPGSVGIVRRPGAVRLISRRVALVALALVLLASVPARADSAGEDRLRSDAPEAWAMFYFASATSFSGFGTPRAREPGSVDVFLDLANIPHLGPEERRVGFDGEKREDLNKSPLFGRPGITIGLPWKTSLSVGYVPPIKLFGVRPNLVSLALERPLLERGPVTLGVRAHSQFGRIRGPYTCPGRVLKFEPGSDENAFGCEAKSNDTAIQRYVGLELSGSYRIDALRGLAPYLVLGVNYLNTEFHVHAFTFGEKDRTRLAADTWTFSLGGGVTFPLGDRIRLALGVLYTPLWVSNPPETPDESDSLVQVRGEISYQLR